MLKTIFLLYHDIDTPETPSEKHDRATRDTVVSLEEFESHMSCLADSGKRVISIKDYLSKQESGTLSPNDIVLTFDDGHISNYRYALPVLKKYGFTATFFIIAQRIGTPYHMNRAELQELVRSGMEIGSHGLTHTYLPKLSKDEISYELTESQRIIEAAVREPVRTFAYPGGHHNAEVLDCMGRSSYNAAASCVVGYNSIKTDPYLFRRLEIRRNTSARDFNNAIKASTIKFYQAVDSVKNHVKNLVGLDRYEILRQKFYFFYPFKR